MSGAPFKYIDEAYTTHRKFSKRLWKSLDFHFENGVEKLWGYASKNPIFHSKLFFRELLENFLFIVWPCSIYLKGAPSIVLYVNKKIGTVRHTNQKIFTKMRKKKRFLITSPGTTVMVVTPIIWTLDECLKGAYFCNISISKSLY